MICTKCGAEIPTGAKFCGQCGGAVVAAASTPTAQDHYRAPQAPLEKMKKKRLGRGVIDDLGVARLLCLGRSKLSQSAVRIQRSRAGDRGSLPTRRCKGLCVRILSGAPLAPGIGSSRLRHSSRWGRSEWGAGGTLTLIFDFETTDLDDTVRRPVAGTVVLAPTVTPAGDITWDCRGGTLAKGYRPAACRP